MWAWGGWHLGWWRSNWARTGSDDGAAAKTGFKGAARLC